MDLIRRLLKKYGSKALDAAGGMVPTELERAKKVDLITLPPDVEGTNCGNCRFVTEWGDSHFCAHPEVRMEVNQRNCCALWDNDKATRAWED